MIIRPYETIVMVERLVRLGAEGATRTGRGMPRPYRSIVPFGQQVVLRMIVAGGGVASSLLQMGGVIQQYVRVAL